MSVALRWDFIGNATIDWTDGGSVQPCGNDTTQAGAQWVCPITMSDGPRYSWGNNYTSLTVDNLTVVGAPLDWISPTGPQTMGWGTSISYVFQVTIPGNASGIWPIQIVVDSTA